MIVDQFLLKFKEAAKDMSPKEAFTMACQLIGKRLVHDNLALRKQMVGEFLYTIRTIQQQSLDDSNFEHGVHTKSSEPYFADVAYKVSAASDITVINRDKRCLTTKNNVLIEVANEADLTKVAIAVDTNGTCHLSLDDDCDVIQSNSWKCNIMCKEFTNEQKKIVIDLKQNFGDSVGLIRSLLEHVDDGCGHTHYCKHYHVESSDEECCFKVKERLGHPLHCAFESCDSQLRLLRAGAVHYPALRTLLSNLYRAKRSSQLINKIESDLSNVHNIESLKENLKVTDLASLLQYDELPSSTSHESTSLSTSESHLEVEFAKIIKEYNDKLKEDPEFSCCSCERLLPKKYVTRFILTSSTEKFKIKAWNELKTYLLEKDPDVCTKTLYVCNHCKPLFDKDKIADRCVLNGLFTEPCPEELLNLNTLESQFLQRAKCFQTVVRLGTYTGKVPVYNCLKAVKGTVFFLPLPLQNTLDRLDEVGFQCEESCENVTGLPDPELYIIVDSRPTKDKVVWQTLVDIDHVKIAVDKLRDINWLYSCIVVWIKTVLMRPLKRHLKL